MSESRLQSWRGESRAITGSLQLAVPSEAQAAWALVEWGCSLGGGCPQQRRGSCQHSTTGTQSPSMLTL